MVCGIAVGFALGLRVADRAVNQGLRSSLDANIADATLTIGTFGLLKPIAFATKDALKTYPLWQQAVAKGAMGSSSFANSLGSQVKARTQQEQKEEC